jgi:hypothetical protein
VTDDGAIVAVHWKSSSGNRQPQGCLALPLQPDGDVARVGQRGREVAGAGPIVMSVLLLPSTASSISSSRLVSRTILASVRRGCRVT